MRTTSTALVVVLSLSGSLVAASPTEGRSIQALLDRYSQRSGKAIPINTIPDELASNRTFTATNFTQITLPHNPKHNSNGTVPIVVANPKAADSTSTDKLVKRVRGAKPVEKRVIWDTKIWQDDTSGASALPAGVNVNYLSNANAAPVNTPAAAPPVAPSFPPRVSAPVASSSSASKPSRKAYKHHDIKSFSHDKERRWVWSNQIIQDDTPDAPAVGVNVNLLSSNARPVATPAATLVAPSFPPIPAASLAAIRSALEHNSPESVKLSSVAPIRINNVDHASVVPSSAPKSKEAKKNNNSKTKSSSTKSKSKTTKGHSRTKTSAEDKASATPARNRKEENDKLRAERVNLVATSPGRMTRLKKRLDSDLVEEEGDCDDEEA